VNPALARLVWSFVSGLLLFSGHDLTAEITAPDSAAISGIVEGFHRALVQGDRATALQLLAPDALILENGETQTREEYEREHLGADNAFAQATKTERSDIRIQQQGDAAWVSAKSKTTGMFNGREVDILSIELIVLTKSDSGWRIHAIHWSSRRAK
jgi:ketosteroid isomerase-like protein